MLTYSLAVDGKRKTPSKSVHTGRMIPVTWFLSCRNLTAEIWAVVCEYVLKRSYREGHVCLDEDQGVSSSIGVRGQGADGSLVLDVVTATWSARRPMWYVPFAHYV